MRPPPASGHVVTLGEIMLRLSASDGTRLEEAQTFTASYGGCEANVAVALAQSAIAARFVTRVPATELGDAAVRRLRALDVDTQAILRGGTRLGVYYLEPGAAQRPSKVVYDRAGSAFATLDPESFDWPHLLSGARWFHTSGITPAVAATTAQAAIDAATSAAQRDLDVSIDLNYRSKLWTWTDRPSDVMHRLVESASVIIGNMADAANVFGIRPDGGDVTSGCIEPEVFRGVCLRGCSTGSIDHN